MMGCMNQHPYRVGTRVKVLPGSGSDGYQVGRSYTVANVDTSDSTYRLRASDGSVKGWISFSSVQTDSVVGWEFLKRHLPEEALELLAAFKGLETLELDEQVVHHILGNLPDLRERILEAMGQIAGEGTTTAVAPASYAPAADLP